MAWKKNDQRFSFLYDGKCFWDYAMQTSVKQEKDGLITEYLLKDGLKVTNIVKKYADFDALEWVTWFENAGDKPTGIISDLYDCDAVIPFEHENPRKWCAYPADTEKSMKVYSPSGSKSEIGEFYCDVDEDYYNEYFNYIHPGEQKEYKTDKGRSSNQKAPFFNIFRQGKGVIFAIGWTGQWNCRISRSEDFVNIKTKIEDTHFRLLAGEKIRTSSIVIMNYECSYDEAQNKWRRLVKKHFSLIGQKGRDTYAPFCAGIWGGMSSEGVINRINAIRENELPFEYIWMDAGWYGTSKQESPDEFEGDWAIYTGDWRVNPTHHPDGLLDVTKAIRQAGLKFLLWFEPERADSRTPAVSMYPGYFIGSPNDNEKSVLLNLGDENAWQYCFDLLSEKIETLGIDCYRQDFNIDPLAFWRKNDSWDRKGITEIKHIMGLYRLWDALLEKFPHLIIDNCSSGGRRIDIETLRRSVPLWRSDAQCPANYPPKISQAHNMTFGTWMPYSGTGTGREWGDVYRIRSAYASGMTTNYSFSEREAFGNDPKQMEWLKKYGAEYLRVRPYLSCDFYPLTELVSGDDSWCASQYSRTDENDGIVQVFKRPKSPYTTASFELRGIKSDKTYQFTDADDDSVFEVSGECLLKEGLTITIKETRVAKLYFYIEK